MFREFVDWNTSGLFPPLVKAFLEKSTIPDSFHAGGPHLESIQAKLDFRKQQFPVESRKVLTKVLVEQYLNSGITPENKLKENIEKLNLTNSFTVCSGHQPVLGGGPVFCFYKAVQTILLARHLSEHFPDSNFLPVFWMAAEDHDEVELNHFYYRGRKVDGAPATIKIPFGRREFNLQGFLNQSFPELDALGLERLHKLKTTLEGSENNAAAFRRLLHLLLGAHGLIVLDGDHAELKKSFIPVFVQELEHRESRNLVDKKTIELENLGFDSSLKPRDINFFYMGREGRMGLLPEADGKVKAGSKTGDLEFWVSAIKNIPENFSPNVVLRPVYQESVLPNLAYIGGGGEISYWLQLKDVFNSFGTSFPVLVPRNSVTILNRASDEIIKSLNLNFPALAMDKANALKPPPTDGPDFFAGPFLGVRHIFDNLAKEVSASVDPTLGPSILAAGKRMEEELEKLKKKTERSWKERHGNLERKSNKVGEFLFPKGNLQERMLGVLELYLDGKTEFVFRDLEDHFQPFNPGHFFISED